MSKVYPVVHHLNDSLALEQVDIAYNSGADGVFLISHNGTNENLPPLVSIIKSKYPGFKVGLNFLGYDIMSSVKVAASVAADMVWGDSCGVSSQGLTQEGLALSHWVQENPNVEVFASVAFKYQKTEHNPPLAAQKGLEAGFVPTTSGSGTGSAPSLEKIIAMSEAVNGKLAIASGMDCENVKQFAPYLSDILVATGVSVTEHRFDEEKLKAFIGIVKEI